METAPACYPHKCVLPHFKHLYQCKRDLYECKRLNALTTLNALTALNASLQPCRAPSDRMRACRAPKPTYTDTQRNRGGKQPTQTHRNRGGKHTETEEESSRGEQQVRANLTHSHVLAAPPSTSSALHLLSDAQKKKRENPKGSKGRDQ